MEVLAVLRVLWGRRLLVLLGGVLSVVIGVGLGASPVPDRGLASTRVAVDTPRSQLVTDAPLGADSLPWRATLLATGLAAPSERKEMARAAGIATHDLAIVELELAAPPVPASLPRAAVRAAAVTTEPYVLAVRTDGVLPVVEIETHAPDRKRAARLAEAAVLALQSGASPQDTPERQGLNIERITPIETHVMAGGSGRAKMAAMAGVLFCLWCASFTLVPVLRSAWRTVVLARAPA
jgi:hypothetical protein